MAVIPDLPTSSPVIESTGLLTLPYILFLSGLFTGDTGTPWTPVATSLGTVGTPTITGSYFRSGQFMDFEIQIVPATSTTSTASTTYFDLPFDVLSSGGCIAVANGTGAAGMVDAATNRVYPPSWSAVTTVVTITGRVRAR